MGREATIKRSQVRQGPTQNPELVLLALTPALYPLGCVCPCVKDEVPQTRGHYVPCCLHTPSAFMALLVSAPQPLLWCLRDVSMMSRFTKGKEKKGPKT